MLHTLMSTLRMTEWAYASMAYVSLQVMEAVCVLLDVKPTRVKDPSGSGKMIDDYWPSAGRVLQDPNFIRILKEYDKDNVPVKVRIVPYIISTHMTYYISHVHACLPAPTWTNTGDESMAHVVSCMVGLHACVCVCVCPCVCRS